MNVLLSVFVSTLTMILLFMTIWRNAAIVHIKSNDNRDPIVTLFEIGFVMNNSRLYSIGEIVGNIIASVLKNSFTLCFDQ